MFLQSTMFLLSSIVMVGTNVEVSICEITIFVELPKRAFTWEGSMKLIKLVSPTNEKVVSFGFCSSGGLRIATR